MRSADKFLGEVTSPSTDGLSVVAERAINASHGGRAAKDITVRQLVQLSVGATTGALLFVGLLLVVRRWDDGVSQPLGFWPLILTSCVLACTGFGLRTAMWWSATPAPGRRASFLLTSTIFTIVMVLFGIALPAPDTRLFPWCLFWLILLSGEAISAWFLVTRSATSGDGQRRIDAGSIRESEVLPAGDGSGLASEKGSSNTETMAAEPQVSKLTPEVTQRFTRSDLTDGGEQIHGIVRAQFVVGERNKSIYVAFCPPFEHTPQIDLLSQCGPDAKVEPTQVVPYGARFTTRLAKYPTRTVCLTVEFRAVAQQ